MADHGNYCHPWDDSHQAFAEKNAACILEASKMLSNDSDRRDTAIFIAVSYLMRNLDRLLEKLGDDEDAQRRYWAKAMWTNAAQHDRKEARYANLLCQVSEESWLDAVAKPVPDSADAALARIALQRKENRLQQEMDGAKLVPKEKQVYVLRKVLEMSFQKIADELGISKTGAKKLWNSADVKMAEFQNERSECG